MFVSTLQNSAARLILQARKREHITPLLHTLHWLPYNFFSNSSPTYLSSILTVYKPKRTLRSSTDMLTLEVPRVRSVRFGERSFTFCASKQWNSLPLEIRRIPTCAAFKKSLKTFLFRKYLE